MAVPNTYIVYTNVADAVLFAFFYQKKYYYRKYQSLFIKVKDWAMLKFHKDYSIFSFVGVTKKPIQ